jgi:hypothetical protein
VGHWLSPAEAECSATGLAMGLSKFWRIGELKETFSFHFHQFWK